jgi:hypothetical protein
MNRINYVVTEYPVEKFYKDEGGKNAGLFLKIKFTNKIIFKNNDIIINVYSGNRLLNLDEKNECFKLMKVDIDYKNLTLVIKFRINKVSRSLDNKKFKIKVLSDYFQTIELPPIYVLSKRKKRKFKEEISNGKLNEKIINLEKRIKVLEKNLLDFQDLITIDTLPLNDVSDIFLK